MSFRYSCDICDKKKEHDDSTWFTLAVNYLGGRGIQIWKWPTGRDLQEKHDTLYHLCSIKCLQAQILLWATK